MAYGTVSADVIQSSVANTSLGAGNSSIMKNRIINGAMVIDQRNSGASVTPSNNQYITDRWKINYSGNFTCQQNAGSVTPPVGFTNYLGATSTGTNSPSGATTYSFVQVIEGYNLADLGWGSADAKTVTLSFWVRSSSTGTFGGSVQNSAANRSYPFSYTISSTNTWEQKSITIAGDTAGTWVKDNGIGLTLTLCMGGGASYQGTAGAWGGADYRTVSGQTNALAASTNYFYITGVQLEVGSSATGFEYRQYGQELSLCERYYQKLGGVAYAAVGMGIIANLRTYTTSYVKPSTTMRTGPTLTANNLITTDRLGYDTDITGVNSTAAAGNSIYTVFSHAATGTSYYPTLIAVKNGTTGYLELSAEL